MIKMEKEYSTEASDQETEMIPEEGLKDDIVEAVHNAYDQVNETLMRASSDIGVSMAQLAMKLNEFTRMYMQTANKICCNNWRRFHGLPTIRRKHERRY